MNQEADNDNDAEVRQGRSGGSCKAVRHARAGTNFDMGFDEGDVDPYPGLFLAKDEGVYLQSNSKTPNPGYMGRQTVAYAKGHDPFKNEDWFARGRQVLGDDEMAELIPLFVFEQALEKRGLLSRILGGEQEIRLAVSEHGFGVVLRSPEAVN